MNEKGKKPVKFSKEKVSGLFERKFELIRIKGWKEILAEHGIWAYLQLPDLTVLGYHGLYIEGQYVLTVTIGNIGNVATQTHCLVYVNAISSVPVEGINEIRIQRHGELPPLDANPPDNKTVLTFRFPLAEMVTKDVDSIEILVDSKGYIVELRENNNREAFPWP